MGHGPPSHRDSRVAHERVMLLLDTNVWLKFYWQLPLPARLLMALEKDSLAVSSISILEAATLIRKGRLPGVAPLQEWLLLALDGYAVTAFSSEIAAAAGSDGWEHQDPADRILVQTAKILGYTLLHTDATIRERKDFRQMYFKLPQAWT